VESPRSPSDDRPACSSPGKWHGARVNDSSSTTTVLASPRWYSAPRLWTKLRKAAATAGIKTLFAALTLFYCLQDHDTPKWAKGVIVGALGYLILPTDLIPDIIPGIGYGDDWGALVAALGTVTAYIKDEHKSKAESQLARLFGSKKAQPPAEFIE